MVYRVLAAGVVAVLLLGTPVQVVAMEKEAPADRAIGWLAAVWVDLSTWFAGKVAPPPSTSGEADGGCWVDPFGCPHGDQN